MIPIFCVSSTSSPNSATNLARCMDKGLYKDSRYAEGIDCVLTLNGRSLYIYLQNPQNELIIWTPELATARLHGATLLLQHRRRAEQSVECIGQAALHIADAWTRPAPPKPKGRTSRRVYTFFLLVCLAILLLGVLAYIYLLPWLASRAVALVPVSTEAAMGEQIAQVYDAQSSPGDSANYYANAFLNELHVSSPYTLKVSVIRSPEINAFAVPGGHIYIYTGLLDRMQDYRQLAALLGHELAHVQGRHSLKSMMRQAASGLVIATVFGDVSGLSPWLVSRADDFRQLDYSRSLESEADAEGVQLMQREHIDVQGMLSLLELLNKEAGEVPGLMKYLSTHPDTQQRIDDVRERITHGTYAADPHPELERLFARLQRH